MSEHTRHGLLASFTTAEAVVEAARQLRSRGFREIEAYTPYPVEGLDEVLRPGRRTWLPAIIFAGAVFGAVWGYFIQAWDEVLNYPINVGGRPLYALSAFAVVAFELTVLFAALTPALGMLALNGLPRLHHPVFGARAFSRASRDRFFLCVLADDPQFDARETARWLRTLDPASVELVTS